MARAKVAVDDRFEAVLGKNASYGISERDQET
jgi:hypothetical protein